MSQIFIPPKPNLERSIANITCLFAVTLEMKHMSGIELPNGGDMSCGTEVIEHSIPEELAVTLSDRPYEPMQSPLREELPPIPGSGADHEEGTRQHSDLDAQIERLQNELERCKRSIGQDTGGPPICDESDPLIAHGTQSLNYDSPDGQYAASDTTQDAMTGTADKRSKHAGKNRSFCGLLCRMFRFFLVTFIMLAFMVCLILMVAIETDAPIPVIQNVRQWTEVQHFRRNHYLPAKNAAFGTIKRWFS